MLPYDVRNFTEEQRERLALKMQTKKDFKLPPLQYWNYELCRQHRNGWEETYFNTETQQEETRIVRTRPKNGCHECGIIFRKHQKVSIMWLYLKKRALLADTPGTGKTTSAGALLAMLAQTGELGLWGSKDGNKGRALIVPRAPALGQWQKELDRMVPGLHVQVAQGPPKKRSELYLSDWQVMLVSPQTLANDWNEKLSKFEYSVVITDDVDTLRNPDNLTAKYIKKAGRQADRMVIMTGTPLQKRLPELHSVLDPIGGLQLFGPVDAFVRKHMTKEWVREYDRNTGEFIGAKQMIRYRGLNEVKKKMAPLYMRRTANDIDDSSMPAIQPEDVFLDMYPIQRAKYNELQRGVIQIMKETGPLTKHVTAMSKLTYGAQICGGLASLGEEDGPNTSVKMDWIMENIGEDGAFDGEKVVIFAQYKNSIEALQRRFEVAGIGYETIWGNVTNPKKRMASQERFWKDPNCRILIGTQSIEQSLNLQVARHLINMDMIMNPARMEQLAGRIRREGSAFKTVYVHNLLITDSQEERYLPLLEREAALAAHIWDENSELFQALDPMMLMQLITG